MDGGTREYSVSSDLAKIGRSDEMDVVIPKSVAGISRHHATLRKDGSRWLIEDAESRNGTFVNSVRVTSAEVHNGDEICLGQTAILLRIPEERLSGSQSGRTAGITGSLSIPPSVEVKMSDELAPSVNVSLSMRDFELLEHQPSFGAPQVAAPRVFNSGDLVPQGTTSPSETRPGQLAAPPTSRADSGSSRLLSLFSDVGRALLVSTDLDEMLEVLLTLIFLRVPAERGLVGLIDEKSGQVIPKVTRAATPKVTGQLEMSRTIVQTAINSQTALLIQDTMGDERFQNAPSVNQMQIRSAMCVPLYHEGRVSGIVYLDTRNSLCAFQSSHLEMVAAISMFTAVAVEQFRLRERALLERRQRDRLARYSSPSVVSRILQAGDDGHMLADKADVTVLFSDLKGFTTLSEQKPAAEVVEILNAIFARLTDAVFREQGTLDKFMGDGMMAFFGAPLQHPDHALRAVNAAWEMLTAVAEFNRTRPNFDPIGIRIGINSGPVIAGDIGSPSRKDYTVIGDTVNIASRLESSVAGTDQIAIGQATYEAIRNEFECETLAPVKLKGKSESVQAYRVVRRHSAKR